MHKFLAVSCVLIAVLLAGCGGGGGGSTTETQDFEVTLAVPAGAAPDGETPQVVEKTAQDVPLQPEGSAFIAAAEGLPHGTVFSSPVTLTFTLTIPLATDDSVDLFQYSTASGWTQVPGAQEVVSGNRLVVTVSNISAFSDEGHFALFLLPKG